MKLRSAALPLLALLLGAAVQLGCSAQAEGTTQDEAAADGADEEAEDEAIPVEVVGLERGDIEALLKFTSNLEAESAVEVLSEAQGRVLEVRVEEGDEVAAGQVLARLDDAEQRSSLARAEAELDKAQREHERQETLHAKGLVSDKVFNDSLYERDRLRLAVADTRRELARAEIRAPIAGTVTDRLVQAGGHVKSGDHLFELTDFDSLVAKVYVPEKELSRLSVGQSTRVTARAAGLEARPGTVARIAPTVDAASGTVKVTVGVPRAEGLLPGMFVELELVTATHADAVLVPKRALVWADERPHVFRLADDGRVDRLALQAALEDRWFVEPATGFEAGDRIVVAGQSGLKHRALVRVVGDEDTASEAAAADSTPQS